MIGANVVVEYIQNMMQSLGEIWVISDWNVFVLFIAIEKDDICVSYRNSVSYRKYYNFWIRKNSTRRETKY